MKLTDRLAALARVPLSGIFMTDKGGSVLDVGLDLRSKDEPTAKFARAKTTALDPTDMRERGGVFGSSAVERLRPRGNETGGKAQRLKVPNWLQERHDAETKQREKRCMVEAERLGKPVGIVMDTQTKQLLADAKRGTISEKTMTAYRRDVARMFERGQTPYDTATSAKHWSRLRAAWIAVEVEAIQQARKSADRYQRAGDIERAKRRTREAWQRGIALDRMFFQPKAPGWAEKRAEMKARGEKVARKSKRYGPTAPTAESLLFSLQGIRGAADRHSHRATVLALFGLRPEEMRKGVEIKTDGTNLIAMVKGAKVDSQRGNYLRACAIPAKVKGTECAAAWLAAEARAAGGVLKVESTDADIQSLNNALGRVAAGLSCYSFRHRIGSDLKASAAAGEITQQEAAAFMGHRSEKSLSYYGRASNGRRGRGMRANTNREVEPIRQGHITRSSNKGAAEKKRKAAQSGQRLEVRQVAPAKKVGGPKFSAGPPTTPRPPTKTRKR